MNKNKVLGFTVYKKPNGLWYATKRIKGKLYCVYIGKDNGNAEVKIRLYLQKTGLELEDVSQEVSCELASTGFSKLTSENVSNISQLANMLSKLESRIDNLEKENESLRQEIKALKNVSQEVSYVSQEPKAQSQLDNNIDLFGFALKQKNTQTHGYKYKIWRATKSVKGKWHTVYICRDDGKSGVEIYELANKKIAAYMERKNIKC